MRGLDGDPYDPRQRRQMEDGNAYLPGNSVNNHHTGYPVEARLPYPSALAASAYFQMPPQQQQQLRSVFASPHRMEYDTTAYSQYPEAGLSQQYGRIAPPTSNLHDDLVPPNLMAQHHPPPPLDVYDLPTSPMRQSLASPTNMGSLMDRQQQQQQQQQPQHRPKVRYDERVQVNLQSPDASRKEDRNPENEHRDLGDEDDEGKRYQEIYHQVFARHSRTPSETRTQTEHTRGTPYAQTTASGSTSGSSDSSQTSSAISSSFSDVEDWEENIRSTLNEMAGNLKNLGGIHCNQAGPDSTELQLKLNLPVPKQYMDQLDIAAKEGLNQLDMAAKQGLNTAMATLSPKKCNMQYGYDNLDEGVFDMEERFAGTLNDLQGNVMPVYKSLFQSQSDETSDDDEDEDTEMDDEDEEEEESSYEDPRFIARQERSSPNVSSGRKKSSTKVLSKGTASSRKDTPPIHRVPSHIILNDAPSDFSSADSWRLSSTVATLPNVVSKQGDIPPIVAKTNKGSLDVNRSASIHSALRDDANRKDRESPDWIPATKAKLAVVERESPVDEKDSEPIARHSKTPHLERKKKPDGKGIKSKTKGLVGEIPQSIDLVLDSHAPNEIVQAFSEVTTDIPDPQPSQPLDTPAEESINDMMEMDVEKSSLDGHQTKHEAQARLEGDPIKLDSPFDGDQTKLESQLLRGDRINQAIDDQHGQAQEEDELMECRNPVRDSTYGISSRVGRPVLGDATANEVGTNDLIPPRVDLEKEEEVAALPGLDATGGDIPMEQRHQKNTLLSRDELVSPREQEEAEPQKTEVKEENESSAKDLSQVKDLSGNASACNSTPVQKPSHNPLYLRAIRLRKKASSGREEITVRKQTPPTTKKEMQVTPVLTQRHELESAPSFDVQGVVSQPSSSRLIDRNSNYPRQSDETKLELAIDEVFGASGDAPDDEAERFVPRISSSTVDRTNQNVSQEPEHESNKQNDVAKEEECDAPDDERPPIWTKIQASVLEKTLATSTHRDIETSSTDIPEDERLDLTAKEELSFQEEKQHCRDDIQLASDPLEKDFGFSPNIPLVEEPFDIPMDSSQSVQARRDTDESIIHSDQSFLSAKQDTISGRLNRIPVMHETGTSAPCIEADTSVEFHYSSTVGSTENVTESSRMRSSVENQTESSRHRSSLSNTKEESTRETTQDRNEIPSRGNVTSNPEIPFDMELDETRLETKSTTQSNAAPANGTRSEKAVSTMDVSMHAGELQEGTTHLRRLPEKQSTAIDQDTGDLPSCGERTTAISQGNGSDCVKPVAPGENQGKNAGRSECHQEHVDVSPLAVVSSMKADIPSVEKEAEHLVTRRAQRNRAALYKVQGFDEYCKNISGSATEQEKYSQQIEIPPRNENVPTASVSQSSHDAMDKSSSSAHCHQRTLRIDFEESENSSIRAHVPPQDESPIENKIVECSSIDQDADIYEAESEYSTTNTHDHSVATSNSKAFSPSSESQPGDSSDSGSYYSDSSEPESSYMEEQSDIDTDASSGHESERKDVLQNMKSIDPQNEHDLHMSATRRLRNQIDVDQEQ
ncbi:MAG: hypothetical protein SGILL_003687, partial [Bacillariaceae sp.]